MAEHATRVGAHLCANVVAALEIRLRIEPLANAGGFVASSTDAAFVAVIDRDCSWWNDAAPNPPEYTLQHEQVHFAIAEVVARRLTREHRELRGFGATPVEAAASLGRQSDALVRRSGDEMAARSLAFDQETSAVFEPSAQAAWYHRLMGEIGQ